MLNLDQPQVLDGVVSLGKLGPNLYRQSTLLGLGKCSHRKAKRLFRDRECESWNARFRPNG